MKPSRIAVLAAPLCLMALGCGGGGGTPQPTMCFGADVVANETNDYAFSSTITLQPVTVAPMSNLTFDWSGLTKDFLGRPLAPATDLGTAIVMIWDLALADFETALNADALYTADLVVSPPLNLPLAGATSGQLYDFLVNGTAVTPAMFNAYFDATLYTPDSSTFIVGVQTGTDLGRNIRMLQAMNLDASSTVTNVALTNTSTKLTYTANLHDLTITGVPGGTPALDPRLVADDHERARRRVPGRLRDERRGQSLRTDARRAREAVPRPGSHRDSRPTAPTSRPDPSSISRRSRMKAAPVFRE